MVCTVLPHRQGCLLYHYEDLTEQDRGHCQRSLQIVMSPQNHQNMHCLPTDQMADSDRGGLKLCSESPSTVNPGPTDITMQAMEIPYIPGLSSKNRHCGARKVGWHMVTLRATSYSCYGYVLWQFKISVLPSIAWH